MNSQSSALYLTDKPKDWTDYSTGIAWGTVSLFFVVVASYLGLIAGLISGHISLLAGMLIATVIIYLGFTVAHEAGHGNIAHEISWMKPYERLMGWSMNLLFLVLPFGLFAKIHDYHHAFTNDPDRDPDHWVSGDTWLAASPRATMLPFHYLYLTATRFKNDPVITRTHKASIIYYLITATAVTCLILAGFAKELLIIGILPIFFASFVLGMLFDWVPHRPNRHQGRYQNTRSYLFPGLKFLTLGQNYHHIHHLYPRVSWYHYQRVFNRIRPELEAKHAPIEVLFSQDLPGYGQSPNARKPSVIDRQHKLTLKVETIGQLTPHAVTISFENLDGKTIPFKAGQYVTLSKLIEGEPVTRCYSICSTPQDNRLSIGVKQVEGGVMSHYLNQQLKPRDEITVAGPFGDFIFDPLASPSDKPLVLIAGGSGITPIMSIARTALESDPNRQVHLIYANQSVTETLFYSPLNQLQKDYPEQFNLIYLIAQPEKGWQGYTGHLDDAKLDAIFSELNGFEQSLIYLCGPEVMKEIVLNKLAQLPIPEAHIFVEAFAFNAPKPEGAVHQVTVELANGQAYALDVAENQTVLQAATEQGVAIPHACGVGQCGCCMMKVVEGDTALASEETPGLLPGEKAQGYTLACQCQPRSSVQLREMTTM
jgi:ferredoxin-NADP reductase/fatty acid desaturase